MMYQMYIDACIESGINRNLFSAAQETVYDLLVKQGCGYGYGYTPDKQDLDDAWHQSFEITTEIIDQLPKEEEDNMTTTETTTDKPDSDEVIAGLLDQINKLNDELAQERANITTAVQEHLEDISLIGKKLLELADDHDWCSTYDDEVAKLNESLHVALPVRHKKFTAGYTMEVEFECAPGEEDDIADEVARTLAYESHHSPSGRFHILDVRFESVES